MRGAWLVSAGVILFLIGYVYGQSLLDAGPYNSLTLGDGTGADWCVVFDDGTDRELCWDDSEDELSSNVKFNVTFGTVEMSGIASPTMAFNSSSSANAASEGSFVVGMTDTTGGSEDAEFQISAIGDGSLSQAVRIGQNPTEGGFVKWLLSSPGIDSYTGDTGYRNFGGSRKYQFDNKVYINDAGDGIVLTSPDASCSLCTVDNSDVLSCTGTTCPS